METVSLGILIAILIGVVLFIWFSIKIAKHSFKFLDKNEDNKSSGINSDLHEVDIGDFRFVSDMFLKESEVVSTAEDIPLDNRHGSSPLISEHEFSRTVTNSFSINKESNLNARIKTSLWSLLETEIKKNLTKSLGIEVGEQVTRRVTVRLEAAPGKFDKYRLTWKQKQREGAALISVENKEIQVPYTTTYGLFHSVESIQQ